MPEILQALNKISLQVYHNGQITQEALELQKEYRIEQKTFDTAVKKGFLMVEGIKYG